MINSNLNSATLLGGIVPAQTKSAPAPTRGDSAFEEALAGAHTVRDQRDARATQSSRDADASRSNADRTRTGGTERRDTKETTGTERSASQDDDAAAVSADGTEVRASDETDGSDAADAPVATDQPTGQVVLDENGQPLVQVDPAAAQAAVTAELQATVVVAAAPVVTTDDGAAPVAAPVVVNDASTAIDAAMRLAIDGAAQADTEATVATDAPVTDAEVEAKPVTSNLHAQATTTAAASTQVATGETVEAEQTLVAATTQDTEGVPTSADAEGPTRPIASASSLATSGPAPATTEAKVDTKVSTAQVETTQAQPTQVATPQGAAVAAAATQEVATGEQAQPATLVAAATAEVETDVDAAVVATTDAATAEVTVEAGDGKVTTAATLSGDADANTDGSGPGADADAAIPTQPARTAAQPAITAQLETAVQASQARAAEKTAIVEEASEEASTPTRPIDGSTNLGQNLQGVRTEAPTGANRLREAAADPEMQERIDDIAAQLATRLKLSQAAGGSQVQLSLKPRELGDVTVQMKVREGVVAATVLVDRADSMRTIETNIEELKRSLESQGLTIQEFTVDVRGDSGAGGANARAFAEQRSSNGSAQPSSATTSIAGAAGAIPGLTGDREVSAEEAHTGDVSILA